MAPKPMKTVAAKKSAAKAKAKDKALQQSNLASQANNAKKKLEAAADGKVVVSEEEKAQLQCKVDFFEAYKKLPKNSEGKNDMLEQFSMDKTCQRWADRQKLVESTQLEKATAQSGYMSRFEIAKEEGLNMKDPNEKKILDLILSHCPQDDNWDETEPRQKALKEAKEVRYRYEKRKADELTVTNSETDRITAGGQFKKNQATALNDGSSSTSGMPPVKEENPEYIEFVMKLSKWRVERSKFGRKVNELEDCYSLLEKKPNFEQTNLEEVKHKVKMATEALSDLRERQMKMELVQENEFDANVHKLKCLEGITETEAQMEGLSTYMKKVKRWCSKTT